MALQLTQLGAPGQAEALLDQGIRHMRERDAMDAASAIVLANIRLVEGRFTEASALASECLAKAGCGQLRFLVPVGYIVMAAASLRQADLRTAMHYSRLLMEDSLFGRLKLFKAYAGWTVAQTLQMEQGTQAAADRLREVTSSAVNIHELLLSHPSAAPWLVRSAVSTGDRPTAARVVAAARRLASKNEQFKTLGISASHAAGLFHQDAEQLLRASAEHTDPWTRVSALEDLGVLLAGQKSDQNQAVKVLERAMDAYHSLGAAQDVMRVKCRLRATGSLYHHTRCSAGSAAPAIPKELTEAETRVAGLVARGLTNIQVAKQVYLSHHTVAHHLKSIFKKLGVSSRGELTRLWIQRAEYTGRPARQPGPAD
jgi:DNA-binding NarL/FixJ family response regulator